MVVFYLVLAVFAGLMLSLQAGLNARRGSGYDAMTNVPRQQFKLSTAVQSFRGRGG